MSVQFTFVYLSARFDKDDDRSTFLLGKETVIQTIKFVVAVVSSFQLVASVSAAVKGDAPPVAVFVNSFFAAFRFEAPLVHPDCVVKEDQIPFGSEYTVLIFGIVATVFDLLLTVRWFRIEQLLCGWCCCVCKDKHDSVAAKIAAFLRTTATPMVRWASSMIVSLAYVAIVKTSLEMLTCRPSVALGGAFALGKNPTIRCFDDVHSGAFVLSIIALVVVGIAWPTAWLVVLCHHFSLRQRCACSWPMCTHCCDEVELLSSDDDASDAVKAAVEMGDYRHYIALRSAERAAQDETLVAATAVASRSNTIAQLIEIGITCNACCACIAPSTAIESPEATDATGTTVVVRKPTLVAARYDAKGSTGKAYNGFLQTPFEPHYYWLNTMRLVCMLVLGVVRSALVLRKPAFGTAIALFIATVGVMTLYSVITIAVCPYNRAARWHVLRVVCVLIFSTLAATTNLCVTLHELGVAGAREAGNTLAVIIAVLLPIYLVTMLIAFLLARSLGVCKRLGCKCKLLRLFMAEDFELDEKVNTRAYLERDEAAGSDVEWALDLSLVHGGDDDSRVIMSGVISRGSAIEMTSGTYSNPLAKKRPLSKRNPLVPSPPVSRVTSPEHRASDVPKMKVLPKAAIDAAAASEAMDVEAAAEVETSTRADMPEKEKVADEEEEVAFPDWYISEAAPTHEDHGVEVELPAGWEEMLGEEDGGSAESYYYHAESDTSLWHPPTPQDDAAATAKALFDGAFQMEYGVDEDNGMGGGALLHHKVHAPSAVEEDELLKMYGEEEEEEDDDEGEGEERAADFERVNTLPGGRSLRIGGPRGPTSLELHDKSNRARNRPRFAKRKWTPRDDVSLALVLLGPDNSGTPGHGRVRVPPYLRVLFNEIYAHADTDGDGKLSTIELMRMLHRRAKGTPLHGDAHAIFSLKVCSTDCGDYDYPPMSKCLSMLPHSCSTRVFVVCPSSPLLTLTHTPDPPREASEAQGSHRRPRAPPQTRPWYGRRYAPRRRRRDAHARSVRQERRHAPVSRALVGKDGTNRR